MVTRLPSTGSIGCDTADMVMFHGVLRKLYRDAGPLIAGVADGDVAHAAVVADHLDEMNSTLHHHHHGEDVVLWDTLEQRAPACAVHVAQMREQHAAVAALLEALDTALPAWRATADAASRAAVAAATSAVNSALIAHLGQEEREILPVAATTMSQSEWGVLEQQGRAAVPRSRQLVTMGYMLDSMSDEQAVEWMRSELPPPVRLLYRLVGRRQFLAEQKALRTSTV